MPPIATPQVAAGALFFDDNGRVLLVKPAYKPGWDIPGGFVEPGESPRAACTREVREELGLIVDVGELLVVDWAPGAEGDKLLFVFDAGPGHGEIRFADGELTEARFVAYDELDDYPPGRLTRRVRAAIDAKVRGTGIYAEHGQLP
ncbi:NUDIX domain-containing protein [Paractinoplanes rishiriensis]|uniref:Nudix hydrolase domain-containing protein n=1 Tax=Paractinoplanes rishiriensis TaxID=1050105 RepID=A0A919K7F9_9ACTN|nr:NUDIX hydrolase [Actinoplanes rishiriensis]GIF02362.1 hypothetical protein Ari01nite_98260 [Actinoplanes rishiriensis]